MWVRLCKEGWGGLEFGRPLGTLANRIGGEEINARHFNQKVLMLRWHGLLQKREKGARERQDGRQGS